MVWDVTTTQPATFQNISEEPSHRQELAAEPCRMADVRAALLAQGFDECSADLYMNSWRKSTVKQYDVYLEKWTKFCVENGIDRHEPTLIEVVKFCTLLFQQGASYSAINTACSALSSYVQIIDGVTVGAHPLISRHLKPTKNSNPPKARYTFWGDVNTVFLLLRSWHLGIKKLKFMALMLLALVTAQ